MSSDESSESFSDEEFDPIQLNPDEKKKFEVIKIVKETEKTTTIVMTKYEYAALIGFRAKMIDQQDYLGLDIYSCKEKTSMDIAKNELHRRECPLILRRRIGNKIEEFVPNHMILPDRDD